VVFDEEAEIMKTGALSVALLTALPLAAHAEVDPMPVANPGDLHWKPKEALPPGAFGAVVAGDPAKGNYDFIGKFPKGYAVPSHYHTNDCSVVMLRGSMVIARAGQPDREIVEGGFFVLPARMAYVARCAEGCTFLVHGSLPFDIIYSRAEDDPRRGKVQAVGAAPESKLGERAQRP
jgi:hypothetical protein